MRLALFVAVAILLPQEKPSWEEIVARGKKNVERLRDLKTALPRAEFDPRELSRTLGGDPARAAEFVRTRIAREPYRGFMKGAQGALVSRRANWADRALLLATLVAEKDPKLVRGTLAPDKQPPPAVVPPAPAEPTSAEVAARLKTDPARLSGRVEAAAAKTREFVDALWARTGRDFEAVSTALQSAGIAPPQEIASASDEVWWVRVGGRDLERPEGAEEKSVHAVAELPAEDCHRLALRMKIKQGDKEIPVLDVGFRTMDVFGRVLTLSTIAGDNPEKLIKVQSRKPKDYLDALAATSLFVPLVTGGGKPVTGHPFDLSGNKRSVKGGAIQKVEGVAGLFDTLPGGEPKKELTAAWVEVELSSGITSRRDLLRKGSKGRQRVFDLLSTREILVLPGDVSADFSLDLLLESDIALKEAVLKEIQPKKLVAEKRPSRLNARLYQFALLRAQGLRELGARLKTPAPSATGTSLVSFVHRILDGKQARIRAGFDILSNPAADVSKPASWKESGALAAGVLETALEHEVNKTPGAHANTSVQLEKALSDKAALKVETRAGFARVIVPGAPASWYDVHLRRGECLGYTEEGGGQDMTEYATLLANKVEEMREWYSHVELLNSVLECAMNAIDAADSEGSFARCMAGVAIGEAFGWAAGGIIGGAAGAMGTPWARFGGFALEDALGDALGGAMDGTGVFR